MAREKKLSDFGLETVEEAARRRKWKVRTVQRWVENGLIPPVPVGEGRNRKNLLAIADVDGFTEPTPGRPPKTVPTPTPRKRRKPT